MRVKLVLLCTVVIGLLGCANPADKKEKVSSQNSLDQSSQKELTLNSFALKETPPDNIPSTLNSFKPFFIYSDKGSRENHYIPSGFMPDGKCITLNEAWGENCHSGKNCIKVIYDVQCSKDGQKWAGIYWLNPANNWGQRKGGFNLKDAQKLIFWARGEKGGEQIQEFTVGGILGNYPDSDSALIGSVILTPEWREYMIDLRGKDLSYISGGFAWTTNVDVNPESCTFYLDDMRFE